MENNILHLSDIIERVSSVAGIDQQTSGELTTAFIQAVAETLASEGKVTVKQMGTFKLDKNTGKVEFTASKDLNAIVNSSFSIFEPIELAEDFPADDKGGIPGRSSVTPTPLVPDEPVEPSAVKTQPPTPVTQPDSTTEKVFEEKVADTPKPDTNLTEVKEETEKTEPMEPVEPDFEMEESSERRSNPWLFWSGLIIGACIGFIAGYILRPVIIPDNSAFNDNTDKTVEASDTVKEQPDTLLNANADTVKTKAELPKVVTDTVKEGRFLATMSRRHFDGRPEFWIYIYEENRDKIKDPSNVSIGTILVIPEREKYGIDPSSEQSRAKARQRARELTGQE